MKHEFVSPSPVRTADYRSFDEILAVNSKIYSKEAKDGDRGPRKNSDKK